MGTVINLRQARKRKHRAEKAVQAAANRARFGRTRAERAEQAMEAERQSARLKGAIRENRKEDDE